MKSDLIIVIIMLMLLIIFVYMVLWTELTSAS